MTEPITTLRIDFYDDPENPTSETYRGSAQSKGVKFAYPPQAGDTLYPFTFGVHLSATAVVRRVDHGPQLNNDGSVPEAMVVVILSPEQKLLEHLSGIPEWHVSMDLKV